jgi:hypothetical protein
MDFALLFLAIHSQSPVTGGRRESAFPVSANASLEKGLAWDTKFLRQSCVVARYLEWEKLS